MTWITIALPEANDGLAAWTIPSGSVEARSIQKPFIHLPQYLRLCRNTIHGSRASPRTVLPIVSSSTYPFILSLSKGEHPIATQSCRGGGKSWGCVPVEKFAPPSSSTCSHIFEKREPEIFFKNAKSHSQGIKNAQQFLARPLP
jgi:hypothetical protein